MIGGTINRNSELKSALRYIVIYARATMLSVNAFFCEDAHARSVIATSCAFVFF